MFQPTLFQIYALIFCGVYLLIVLPIFVYLISRYWKNQEKRGLVLRYPKLSLAVAITFSYWLTIHTTLVNFQESFNITLIQIITLYSGPIIFNLALGLFSEICWLLMFDVGWNTAMANATWREKLNPDDTNWYITNKSTWGSVHYVTRILVVVLIFQNAIALTSSIWSRDIYRTVTLVNIGLDLIGTGIFWKRIPFVAEDTFNVRLSYTICINCGIFGVVGYGICIGLRAIQVLSNAMYFFVLHWVLTVALGGIVITFMEWPFYMRRRGKQTWGTPRRPSSIPSRASSSRLSGRLDVTARNCANKIMARTEIYEAFVHYLVREYCFENILFVTELAQLKMLLYNETRLSYEKLIMSCDVEDVIYEVNLVWDNVRECYFRANLSSNIPNSRIIADTETTSFEKCVEIFEKYINTTAPYCLNLSWDTRKTITENITLLGAKPMTERRAIGRIVSGLLPNTPSLSIRDRLSGLRNSPGRSPAPPTAGERARSPGTKDMTPSLPTTAEEMMTDIVSEPEPLDIRIGLDGKLEYGPNLQPPGLSMQTSLASDTAEPESEDTAIAIRDLTVNVVVPVVTAEMKLLKNEFLQKCVLYFLFDNAGKEVYDILYRSYLRFTTTEEAAGVAHLL